MIAKTYLALSLVLALIWGGVAWGASHKLVIGVAVFVGAWLMAWFTLSLCYVAGRP